MIHAQQTKKVVAINSASTATNATAGLTIDTRGYSYATFDTILDSAAAVSSNPATFNLQEDDTTVASNFANITAFVGDTAWTIPNADTSNPQIITFNCNLVGRQRYLRLQVTPAGAAQILSSVCTLSRAGTVAANQGAATAVNG